MTDQGVNYAAEKPVEKTRRVSGKKRRWVRGRSKIGKGERLGMGAPIEAEQLAIDDDGTSKKKTRKRTWWWQRATINALKKEAVSSSPMEDAWDARDNKEIRPPESEELHLGGFVLVEAFTPSTIERLQVALKELTPLGRGERVSEAVERLSASRSASSAGGWASLGPVRRPGKMIIGGGFEDPNLPAGVEAVWLKLVFLAPSLTMLVATFTLSEDAAELSRLLRSDFQSAHTDAVVQVNGRLGWLRQRIRWSRPSDYRVSAKWFRAEDEKRRAVEDEISSHESVCRIWFERRFRGRFSSEPIDSRPTVRMLFTNDVVPFRGHESWLRPAGLSGFGRVWRAVDIKGWSILFHSDRINKAKFAATVAARRADAAEPPGGSEDGTSNWFLTQRFHSDQSTLIARWAAACLLSLYSDTLAILRDESGTSRRFSTPVRQGKRLNEYLLGDGLDALTIATDVTELVDDLSVFRWDVPEYSEDLHDFPTKVEVKSAELVVGIHGQLKRQSHRLRNDLQTTTTNIATSANLRQAIANTRLQRAVLGLTLTAIGISIISLLS